MNTKHAVLTDTHLHISHVTEQGPKLQRVALCHPPTTIADVCKLANEHKVTHVWSDIVLDTNVGEPWDAYTYEGVYARIWAKGFNQVKIGFLISDKWPWKCDDPVTVLATVYYLELVLGVVCEWTPGHMGKDLVELVNCKRQEWTREASIDMHELPFGKSAVDLAWKCKVDNLLYPGMFIHEYDKNSDYLSVCPGLTVGAGDPVHVEGDDIDLSLPGAYRVSTTFTVSDNDTLPPVIEGQWITQDILAYAREQGYEITVHEAWQFPDKHQTLRPYAEKLWKARAQLNPKNHDNDAQFPHAQGRKNAYETIKVIALVTNGMFNTRRSNKLLRPDWWAAVVGKSRVNKLRNLNKIWFATLQTPIFIYADGLFFASCNPDGRTAVPGILEREGELGGYKYEDTWQVTPEIVKAFKKMKEGQFLTYLRRLHEEAA